MDWAGEKPKVDEKTEWLKWRGKGIGSSDLPIIMGHSPYKTVYQLWAEKTGLVESTFKGNFATRRGQEMEPLIRDWYNEKSKSDMVPFNFEHKDNKVFRCSVDGVNSARTRLIEIKTAGKDDHQTAKNGCVPEKYIPQVQWLMFVTGINELDYVSHDINQQDGDRTIVFCIADKKYQDNLREKAEWFWHLVETKTPPETGIAEIENDDAVLALATYRILKNKMADIEKEMEQITEKLKGLVTSKKAVCHGYSLMWKDRKGSIDYSKVPQLEGVDLEPFRKAGTTYFEIKELKT